MCHSVSRLRTRHSKRETEALAARLGLSIPCYSPRKLSIGRKLPEEAAESGCRCVITLHWYRLVDLKRPTLSLSTGA